MKTTKVPELRLPDASILHAHALTSRYKMRNMSDVEWISKFGSGTLQNAVEQEVEWHPLYRHERTCYEWGWEFDLIPHTRITFGSFIAEGDCPVTTHVNYFARRLKALSIFDADIFQVKYLHLFLEDGKKEGAGIIVKQTDAQWLPSGYLVYALISEWNTEKKMWGPIMNPC